MITVKSRRISSIENLERRLLFVSPVNHVPGPQTMVEDNTLRLSSATNNGISITDVDGPGPFEVELNSVNGTASIANNPTLTITGNGTNAIRIIGSLANVNVGIANIEFHPTLDFEGNGALQIETDDQNGAGGLTDTDNINITVTPNQSPKNTVPGTQTTGINAFLRFSASRGNLVSFTDVDGPGPFEVELASSNGNFSIVNFSGTTVNGNNTHSVRVTGSLENVIAAISDFIFTPDNGFTGNTLIVVESDDLNGTGGRSDTDAIPMRVVNGTPPLVSTSNFRFETNHEFEFKFNHAIDQATVGTTDISIRSLPSHTAVPFVVQSSTYSPANFSVQYDLAEPLPDGNYEYVILNNAVTDLNGFTNGYYAQPFYVLAGDANRDRSVDFDDLLIAAQNYNQSNRTFSQGNFDYSIGGLVSFPDLLIVAQHYGLTLPSAKFSLVPIGRVSHDVLGIKAVKPGDENRLD